MSLKGEFFPRRIDGGYLQAGIRDLKDDTGKAGSGPYIQQGRSLGEVWRNGQGIKKMLDGDFKGTPEGGEVYLSIPPHQFLQEEFEGLHLLLGQVHSQFRGTSPQNMIEVLSHTSSPEEIPLGVYHKRKNEST
jgi:hypothetical protein